MSDERRQRNRQTRPRQTPRIAGRLCAGCAISPSSRGSTRCSRRWPDKALRLLDVDPQASTSWTGKYLIMVARKLFRRQVGHRTIAAALSEPRTRSKDMIEPFLIQKGFVQRTPRGRILTPHAFRHLGCPKPQRGPESGVPAPVCSIPVHSQGQGLSARHF